MADDEGEKKTQEPSAKRQEDAIEQGQVLTSRDLMVLVVLATGGMQLMMNGKYYFDELVGIFRQDLLFSEPIMRDLPLQTALRNAFRRLIPFCVCLSDRHADRDTIFLRRLALCDRQCGTQILKARSHQRHEQDFWYELRDGGIEIALEDRADRCCRCLVYCRSNPHHCSNECDFL